MDDLFFSNKDLASPSVICQSGDHHTDRNHQNDIQKIEQHAPNMKVMENPIAMEGPQALKSMMFLWQGIILEILI